MFSAPPFSLLGSSTQPAVISAGEASHVALAPYRDRILSAAGWAKRDLPDNAPLWQHPSWPNSNSNTWRRSLCLQMGLDPDTPQTQLTPNYITGHTDGQLWLRREGEFIYVVPDDQPLRNIIDQDTSVSGLAKSFNDIVAKRGGLPIPSDARPHTTADRYAFVYQPSTDTLVTLYAYGTTDPATTTLTLTGTPSSGGVSLKLHYLDHALNVVTEYTTQTPIPFDASAATVKAAVDGAKTSAGAIFNALTGGGLTRCLATGGPLNTAPVVLKFSFCEALHTVDMEVVSSTLDTGTVAFEYHPSGVYDRGRICSVVTPSDDQTCSGLSGFSGAPYQNRFDSSGFRWMDSRWPATASGIDMMSLVPSWEEAEAANAAGTGLKHCLAMSVGRCQSYPFNHVFPATRGDGANSTTDGSLITEGARVRFPADVDLSAVPPEFLFIPRTIRDKGMVLIDKTGGGSEIIFRRAQWPGDPFNPWRDLLPLYAQYSNAGHRYMKTLPWHKMQIVDPAFSA